MESLSNVDQVTELYVLKLFVQPLMHISRRAGNLLTSIPRKRVPTQVDMGYMIEIVELWLSNPSLEK